MSVKITVTVTIKNQDIDLSFEDARQLYNQLQPLFKEQLSKDYFNEWNKMKWRRPEDVVGPAGIRIWPYSTLSQNG